MLVGQVDQQLTLPARIMDADQAAFCHRMRLGEHDQRRGQFVHVIDPLYAISVKQGLVGIVAAGDGAGMGHGQPGGQFGAAHFENNHRDRFVPGFSESRDHALGIAGRFHEQPDGPGFRLIQREIHVLVHADAEFLAGRYRQVEIDTLLAVHDAGHAGAGMADQRDVAAPDMVFARIEAAHPDPIVQL